MDSHISSPPYKRHISIMLLIVVVISLLILQYMSSHALNLATFSPPANVTQQRSLPFEPTMVSLPGGLASIGCLQHHIYCEDDERIHKTYVAPFSIGIFEVTNQQIVPFLNAMGSHKRPSEKQPLLEINNEDKDSRILYKNGKYSVEAGFENHPIVEISWQGAVAYSQWLSQMTGKQYRLPTESEWEYMARAGSTSQYPWGYDRWHGQANCDGCTGSIDDKDDLKAVGSYPPNRWGIYDVLGNVWEWTCSIYDERYTNVQGKCPNNVSGDTLVVLRGSSWFSDPWETRLSNRSFQKKWHQDYHSGFRLAMSGE